MERAKDGWQSLLTGVQRREAERLLHIAVRTLLSSAERSIQSNNRLTGSASSEWALAGGQCGALLFLAEMARAFSRDDWAQDAAKLTKKIVEALAKVPMSPSLFGGFTGISWALSRAVISLKEVIHPIDTGTVDKALFDYLETRPRPVGIDLVNGLAGIGLYALDRTPQPLWNCVEYTVDQLYDLAERTDTGTTWFTPPHLLHPMTRVRYPNGYYNLGVAHGVPGVIGFLGRVCATEPANRKAHFLLKGAVDWLLGQALPVAADSIFPNMVSSDIIPVAARTAWCYGDLGISAVLLSAARHVDNTTWEDAAVRIANSAGTRSPTQGRIDHACLCHGSAGAAHLFNRIFQATGQPQFKSASLKWYGELLDRSSRLGFVSLLGEADDNQYKLGFLMGLAGVGLALLAGLSTREPEWDSVLLVPRLAGSRPRSNPVGIA